MNAETLQLPYGDGRLEFQLKRRARKTLSITVTPDLTIEVVAPLDISIDRIFERVRRRAPWINKQLKFFEQFRPRTPERQFVSGETHRYLGRQYKLKVVLHFQQKVKLKRGLLIVQSHKPQRRDVTKTLVEEWFRNRARVKFQERLEICRERFSNPLDFAPSKLELRRLNQRWGSMTATGKLILNRALISASVDAIDYVITHELCHMEHPHHGPAFFKLLDRVMPDWKRRKAKLEQQLA
jgi:predicted metal-dependent hydrolase